MCTLWINMQTETKLSFKNSHYYKFRSEVLQPGNMYKNARN